MESPSELSFFLRQVDPLAVAKAYLNGTLLLPKEKVKFTTSTLTQDLVIGDNIDAPAYEYIDKNGSKLKIITGNHNNWTISNEIRKEKFICDWCRINYTIPPVPPVSPEGTGGTGGTGRSPVFLPIKIEKDENKIYFHGIGEYCCFECVYADLKTKSYAGFYYRNSVYSDSETLLKYMNHLFTNRENLTSSPHWKLHVKNGGPLTDKDYYNSEYSYGNVANVILKPAKITYIRSEK